MAFIGPHLKISKRSGEISPRTVQYKHFQYIIVAQKWYKKILADFDEFAINVQKPYRLTICHLDKFMFSEPSCNFTHI